MAVTAMPTNLLIQINLKMYLGNLDSFNKDCEKRSCSNPVSKESCLKLKFHCDKIVAVRVVTCN